MWKNSPGYFPCGDELDVVVNQDVLASISAPEVIHAVGADVVMTSLVNVSDVTYMMLRSG